MRTYAFRRLALQLSQSSRKKDLPHLDRNDRKKIYFSAPPETILGRIMLYTSTNQSNHDVWTSNAAIPRSSKPIENGYQIFERLQVNIIVLACATLLHPMVLVTYQRGCIIHALLVLF